MSAKPLSLPPSPSGPVVVRRFTPEEDAPTARTFFAMAGVPMVHESRLTSPSLPAAKSRRCSGFWG